MFGLWLLLLLLLLRFPSVGVLSSVRCVYVCVCVFWRARVLREVIFGHRLATTTTTTIDGRQRCTDDDGGAAARYGRAPDPHGPRIYLRLMNLRFRPGALAHLLIDRNPAIGVVGCGVGGGCCYCF